MKAISESKYSRIQEFRVSASPPAEFAFSPVYDPVASTADEPPAVGEPSQPATEFATNPTVLVDPAAPQSAW
jgi:hypothetical protein